MKLHTEEPVLLTDNISPSAPLLHKNHYAIVVEERRRQAEEERMKKEEAEKKKKEEQEKKKKEDEQKKKEEEKKKAEAKEDKKEPEQDKKKILIERAWNMVDVVLKPVEKQMDSVVGATIDPFTGTSCGNLVLCLCHLTPFPSCDSSDRRYIAWLSLVTLAFNYNTWFVTARLCFPYHTESAIPYWFALDTLADIVYVTDILIFQARKQFVKGGDVIVGVL